MHPEQSTPEQKDAVTVFVQTFCGRVMHAAPVRAALEEWVRDLSAGADGWLGSTAGVTDDGVFVGLARFSSFEAARRNSDRLEQGEWWGRTSQLFAEDIVFSDCREVLVLRRGGADWAGFVSVTKGRAQDVDRLRSLNHEFHTRFPDVRPDLLGTVIALHGDGTFTRAAYFTSEADVLAAEAQEPPSAEVADLMAAEMSLIADATTLELHDPWLYSPP